MNPRRAALTIVLLVGVATLAWWLLGGELGTGAGDDVERGEASYEEPASLRGAPQPEGPAVDTPDASARESEPAVAGERTDGAYDLEVLDYRNAGVAGVQVFHEVDRLGASGGGPGEEWKTLGSGTTDARGCVRIGLDRSRRRQPDEGLNHRIRVVPPRARDDLAPTWRLWSPAQGATFHLSQTHVIEGRVVDGEGEPVWAATVWVGVLPRPGIKVLKPGWRKTTTDPDGRFRIVGIPTTAGWQIDVWAVGPGGKEPASSAEVQGAQSVALDTKTVEILLP